jgi:hypothetical protein
MTGSAQATAAVPAVSGEDDDRVGPGLADVPGEVPTRVLHHLKQRYAVLLDSDPVYLSHLGRRHGGNRVAGFRPKRVFVHVSGSC